MKDDGERALEKKLHELASLIGTRNPWVFFARDERGALVVFSNERPEQIRDLVKKYLEKRRKQ